MLVVNDKISARHGQTLLVYFWNVCDGKRAGKRGMTMYHRIPTLYQFNVSCRNLALIMSEMIQTERDYVRSLQFVIENYLPELLREDVPQALRGKRNVIFGNIEQIHQFHNHYFLRALERCEKSPLHVARIFLKHVSIFSISSFPRI